MCALVTGVQTCALPISRLSSRHFKLSLPGSRPGNPCPSLTPDLSGEARCRGRMGPRDKPEGDNWSGLARHPAAWLCGVRRLYAPAGVLFPAGAVNGMQGRSIPLFDPPPPHPPPPPPRPPPPPPPPPPP